MDQLRNRLIERLRKRSSIEITANPGEADAIITGTGETWIEGFIRVNPKPSPSNQSQPRHKLSGTDVMLT